MATPIVKAKPDQNSTTDQILNFAKADKHFQDRLKNLCATIKKTIGWSQKQVAAFTGITERKPQGNSGSALNQKIKCGQSSTIKSEYLNPIEDAILRINEWSIEYLEASNSYSIKRLGQNSEQPARFSVEITNKLDFIHFMKEVTSQENASNGTVKIIGTWFKALYEDKEARAYLEAMICASYQVKFLLAKPESNFLEDRIRILSGLQNKRQEQNFMNQVYDCLDVLADLKKKYGADKLDFRLYDTFPGIRMLAHSSKIYVNLLLNLDANDAFTTVYANNGGLHAKQLDQNFEDLWAASKVFETPAHPLKLMSMDKLAGVYKVYTYGHSAVDKNKIPSYVVGAMKIESNGAVTQKTFSRAETGNVQINEGWAKRVGNRLFLDVFCVKMPKNIGAYQFNTKEFSGESGALIVGVVATSTRKDNHPVALRIILEKMSETTDFEKMGVYKFPLSAPIDPNIIHPIIHKFLSGIFRNMIRYHTAPITSLQLLQVEKSEEKTVLGTIMYAAAKDSKTENDFQDAFRWAVTHGFDDFVTAEFDFAEINPAFLPYIKRIKNQKN
jgi:hypothetical protein